MYFTKYRLPLGAFTLCFQFITAGPQSDAQLEVVPLGPPRMTAQQLTDISLSNDIDATIDLLQEKWGAALPKKDAAPDTGGGAIIQSNENDPEQNAPKLDAKEQAIKDLIDKHRHRIIFDDLYFWQKSFAGARQKRREGRGIQTTAAEVVRKIEGQYSGFTPDLTPIQPALAPTNRMNLLHAVTALKAQVASIENKEVTFLGESIEDHTDHLTAIHALVNKVKDRLWWGAFWSERKQLYKDKVWIRTHAIPLTCFAQLQVHLQKEAKKKPEKKEPEQPPLQAPLPAYNLNITLPPGAGAGTSVNSQDKKE